MEQTDNDKFVLKTSGESDSQSQSSSVTEKGSPEACSSEPPATKSKVCDPRPRQHKLLFDTVLQLEI